MCQLTLTRLLYEVRSGVVRTLSEYCLQLTIFAKLYILHVWQGFGYAFGVVACDVSPEWDESCIPAGIYLFKFSKGNTSKMGENCSKLTITDFTHCTGVFIVDFEQVNVD